MTLAATGLVVAVGLTLAASSLADESLPAESHFLPIVHVETVPTSILMSPAPTPAKQANGFARGAQASSSPDPDKPGGRAAADHNVPRSDD